jgi:transcriptional regulator with XRE-family HTH domain
MPPAGPLLNPDAIRAIREAQGYSVTELAGAIGITPAHLSNLEAGRRGISAAKVASLARALRVRPAAVLALVECASCEAARKNAPKPKRVRAKAAA